MTFEIGESSTDPKEDVANPPTESAENAEPPAKTSPDKDISSYFATDSSNDDPFAGVSQGQDPFANISQESDPFACVNQPPETSESVTSHPLDSEQTETVLDTQHSQEGGDSKMENSDPGDDVERKIRTESMSSTGQEAVPIGFEESKGSGMYMWNNNSRSILI